MRITFLGTSGYGISPSRNPPAILVNDSLLLDVGEGVTKQLVGLDKVARDIQAILITHGHRDHMLGFWGLLWQMLLVDRKVSPLAVYGFPAVLDTLKSLLSDQYMPMSLQEFQLDFLSFENDSGEMSLSLGKEDFIVTWVPANHSVPALAYKIREKETGQVLGYGGDGAYAKELASFFNGCDLLVLEASFPEDMKSLAEKTKHSTPSISAQLARDSKVKRLFLTHLPPLDVTNPDQFLRDAREIFPKIDLAADGKMIDLSKF